MTALVCFMTAVLGFTNAVLSLIPALIAFIPAIPCLRTSLLSFTPALLCERTALLAFIPPLLFLSCAPLGFVPPFLPLMPAPDSDKDALPSDAPAPASGTSARLEQSGPSLPDDGAPESDARRPVQAVPAPASEEREPKGVTPEVLAKYIARKSTARLMMRVIRAHVAPRTPLDTVKDIRQLAYKEALSAKTLPRSEDKLDAWTAKVTAHAVAHYFRRGAVDDKWLRRDVEAAEQPAEPPEDLRGEERWMIKPWLEKAVAKDPRDKELFDLLVYKAQTGLPYDKIAAERGMTPAALSNRIYRFKLEYLPRRHQYLEEQRRRGILLLLLLLGAAAVAVLLWLASRPTVPAFQPPPPTRAPVLAPRVQPAPPEPFNQALSSQPAPQPPPKPPAPLKPPLK